MWSILNENKLQNFLQVIDDMDVEIACVNETWFDRKNGVFTKKIKDAGFEPHHAYRDGKRGGGVAVLYKSELTVKEGNASTSEYESFEYAYITVTLKSKQKVVILCIYRKQEVSFSLFIEEFSSLGEQLIFGGDALLVVGDFNVWVEVEDNRNGKELTTLMSSLGLNQQVLEPTHREGHTLDHVYVNEFQLNVEHQVIHDTLGITTDHFPIILELPQGNTQNKQKTVHYRKLKNVDMDAFRNDLQDRYRTIVDQDDMNFETLSTAYHKLSADVVDTHAPILKRNSSVDKPKWLDQEYRQSRALRRKFEKQWKTNKTEESRMKYMNQKQICIDMAANKQSEHYSKILEEAGNCQKTLFNIANNLLDKSKQKVLPFYSDPKILANEFNNFYINKVSKIRNSIPESEDGTNYLSRPFVGERLNEFRMVCEDDIRKVVQKSGVKTSLEDPIPAKLMQPSLDVILPVMKSMVNKSLAEGSMDGIKESIVNPLLKKAGLDVDVKNNFRPVNNLLFLSKTIERVVGEQLDEHMTKNNIHEDSQFAYKTHHNTETMMLGITDEVLKGFDENKATVIIFLDLSAAFDTIDVEKVLQILDVEIGVGGVVLKWFRSFLEGRTQKVKIDDEYSDSLTVPCGAPQGSVLGPKIFNINVRSQPMVFKQCMFTSSSFADDSNGRRQFALTFQFNVINNVVQCLHRIINWSNAHYMKINPDKTEILLLCPSSLNDEVIIKGVIFEDQCIRFSTEVKNVGVWLDRNLTMDKHVSQVVSHSYKILRDIGCIKKYLQQIHLERLVHAVISSRLDYCNSLFVNISKENMRKLQRVQNAAAKLILGKRRRESATEALKKLHWLNIEARVTFKILLLVYKILNGLCSRNLELQYKTFNGRDDDYLLLETPSFKTAYGKRIFSYNASRLWNALPVRIRGTETVEKFKKEVKTLLFNGHDELKRRAFKYCV